MCWRSVGICRAHRGQRQHQRRREDDAGQRGDTTHSIVFPGSVEDREDPAFELRGVRHRYGPQRRKQRRTAGPRDLEQVRGIVRRPDVAAQDERHFLTVR